jgi:hypothetical protein
MSVRDFDPDNISKHDMDMIADNIEEYLSIKERLMVIPEELMDGKKIVDEAIRTYNKLIKHLRNYNKEKVFKDREEWNVKI